MRPDSDPSFSSAISDPKSLRRSPFACDFPIRKSPSRFDACFGLTRGIPTLSSPRFLKFPPLLLKCLPTEATHSSPNPCSFSASYSPKLPTSLPRTAPDRLLQAASFSFLFERGPNSSPHSPVQSSKVKQNFDRGCPRACRTPRERCVPCTPFFAAAPVVEGLIQI